MKLRILAITLSILIPHSAAAGGFSLPDLTLPLGLETIRVPDDGYSLSQAAYHVADGGTIEITRSIADAATFSAPGRSITIKGAYAGVTVWGNSVGDPVIGVADAERVDIRDLTLRPKRDWSTGTYADGLIVGDHVRTNITNVKVFYANAGIELRRLRSSEPAALAVLTNVRVQHAEVGVSVARNPTWLLDSLLHDNGVNFDANGSASLYIARTLITRSTAGAGAVLSSVGFGYVFDSDFVDNAGDAGLVIYGSSNVTVARSAFDGNAGAGVAVSNSNTIRIDDSTFTLAEADIVTNDDSGGGTGCTLETLYLCDFGATTLHLQPGLTAYDSTVRVEDSFFDGNTRAGVQGQCGQVIVERSTIVNTRPDANGAYGYGIELDGDGHLVRDNDIFGFNLAGVGFLADTDCGGGSSYATGNRISQTGDLAAPYDDDLAAFGIVRECGPSVTIAADNQFGAFADEVFLYCSEPSPAPAPGLPGGL